MWYIFIWYFLCEVVQVLRKRIKDTFSCILDNVSVRIRRTQNKIMKVSYKVPKNGNDYFLQDNAFKRWWQFLKHGSVCKVFVGLSGRLLTRSGAAPARHLLPSERMRRWTWFFLPHLFCWQWFYHAEPEPRFLPAWLAGCHSVVSTYRPPSTLSQGEPGKQ